MLLNLALSTVATLRGWFCDLPSAISRHMEKRSAGKRGRKTGRLTGPEALEARYLMAAGTIEMWIGPANGLWSAGANWSTGSAPQAGDTLQFGGQTMVGGQMMNGALTSSSNDMARLSVANLYINDTSTNIFNQTINLNNNSLTVTGNVAIANNTPTSATITGGATGILNVTGAQSTFNWGGGTISAPLNFGTVAGGAGAMTINGSDVILDNTFKNYGTITWSSNNPQAGPGPNIKFASNNANLMNEGVFNIQTSSTESINGTNGFLTNDGTMQKTNANTVTIMPTFNNGVNGNLNVNSGTLYFQGIVAADGNIVMNGGNLRSDKTIEIAPTGGNGKLSGVGTITGSVENGGTVTPGVSSVPGSLTITGNYTQDNTGTLVINIDSAGNYGALTIGGAASLNGNLQVNNTYSYSPDVGTILHFMYYGSRQGDFSSINITNNAWPGQGESIDYFAAQPLAGEYDLVVQSQM